MGPSELEEHFLQQPMRPLRVTLATGDQLTITASDQPVITGLSIVLRGTPAGGRITTGSRLVSIPNIVLAEVAAAPTPSAMEEADRSIGFGAFKGKIWISDDFDAPMTEEELREWEKPLDL